MQNFLSKNTRHAKVYNWTAAWKNKDRAPLATRIIDDKKVIFREACMISVRAEPCEAFIFPDKEGYICDITADFIAQKLGDYIEDNNLFKRLPFDGIVNHLSRLFNEINREGIGADMRTNGIQNPSSVEIALSQVDTAVFITHWKEAENAFSFS